MFVPGPGTALAVCECVGVWVCWTKARKALRVGSIDSRVTRLNFRHGGRSGGDSRSQGGVGRSVKPLMLATGVPIVTIKSSLQGLEEALASLTTMAINVAKGAQEQVPDEFSRSSR